MPSAVSPTNMHTFTGLENLAHAGPSFSDTAVSAASPTAAATAGSSATVDASMGSALSAITLSGMSRNTAPTPPSWKK